MKKNYIAPKTAVLHIELQQMIALSASGSTNQTSGNLGRRRRHRDDWEDDWEEDEEY